MSDSEYALDIRQYYIFDNGKISLSVRDSDQPFGACTMRVKGATSNITREEVEILIDAEDLASLLKVNPDYTVVDKTRYHIPDGELMWEVDVFHGANEGLKVAEVELPSEDFVFLKPDWLGEEVSENPIYFNSNLSKNT